MTNTIKITNSQGHEEEWEETDSLEIYKYKELFVHYFGDNSNPHYYKKLTPKEVYPKVFEGMSYRFIVDDIGDIQVIDKDEDNKKVCRFSCSQEALKQALAESERIQSQQENVGIRAFGTGETIRPVDNIQNKTEEKKA